MDHKQTIAMLTWINQVDPRVMLNEASAETWAYAMSNIPADVAKQAVLEHYKAHENIAASPGAISKRAANIKNSREAKQKALEPPLPPYKDPNSWRARNPEEWDRLKEQGRLERPSRPASARSAMNPDRIRAAIRTLYPDEMTPTARNVLERILDDENHEASASAGASSVQGDE